MTNLYSIVFCRSLFRHLAYRIEWIIFYNMETSIELVNSQITMSSLEIAELTNKEHKNVIRDIRAIFEEEIGLAQI